MKDIENIIFDIAEALRVPVLVLALLALAAVLLELGAFVVELLRRRRRDFARLETASHEARAALERGDEMGAKSALRPVAWSTQMARTLAFMVDQWGRSQIGDRLAKGLADFDFRSLKRLERTRLLVRAGPALGLMGTLIPLSPALEGLATGDVNELSENLRVAFSVTVLGLLVGAIAFAISLVRDRIYGQDLSDLEFVMATIAPEADAVPVMAVRTAATDSRIGTVALGGASAGSPAEGGGAAAGAAAGAPPRPSQAANVGEKPPPPKEAKPLGAELPPPGTGVRPDPAPQPAVSASGDVKPGEVAPTPSGPSAAAAPAPPPVPGADEAPAAPAAPAVSGSDPPVPPVPGSPSEAGAPIDRDATRQQSMPPAPPAASPPAAPAAPAPPPTPGSEQAPSGGEDDPTNQLPGPPIPERPADGNNHPPAPERTTGEGTW